jgi:hypothetical protein
MGTADPLPGAALLAAVGGPLFAGNLRQLGNREEANAAVSNNSLLERAIGRPWFRLPCRTLRFSGGPRSGPSAATGCYAPLRPYGDALAELLGEPDEKSFGAADVAEPIRVFVLDHFADELRAALAEPGERLVDVVDGEHDA